ncbi:hypothetical protein ACIP9X_05560 [Arthrobacter sp. NPDC093125]|uniref:hypothetical protein n=1 Tax=Arthrobacter sp. NPDC093125 TaxID=3363944 RepID=UPI00382D801A
MSDWVNLSGTVETQFGADTIHASIHPDREAVTLAYRGGVDCLVIDAKHIDAFITLLQQAKARL